MYYAIEVLMSWSVEDLRTCGLSALNTHELSNTFLQELNPDSPPKHAKVSPDRTIAPEFGGGSRMP